MEELTTSSIPPQIQAPPLQQSPSGLTPEALEALKARAREEAIRMTLLQQQMERQEQAAPPSTPAMAPATPQIPASQMQPQVVYVRRNWTVAELLLILLVACGLVTGVQATWSFANSFLPRIEIKAR